MSPEERGEQCPSLVLRSVAALQRVDLRTSLLTPALLRRLGHAASLQTLELELPDALCAAGPVGGPVRTVLDACTPFFGWGGGFL